jgi:hypothetical protein
MGSLPPIVATFSWEGCLLPPLTPRTWNRRQFVMDIAALSAMGAFHSPLPSRVAAQTATPAASSTDTLTLRLEPGLGNEWCIYNGTSSAPSESAGAAAVITTVRNTTAERISLIYWETAGGRVGPASLSAGHASESFSGLGLAGTWEAHVGGTEADAPLYVTLEIAFAHR